MKQSNRINGLQWKTLREKAGLTQRDVSDSLGYSTPQFISNVERGRCRFCRDKVTRIDYKDVLTLEKLCSNQGRIFSRKRSGNCASHQRMVKKAIKQARVIGLMPFTV